VAWYNDISHNFTAIGRSSGKISSYLKFGLPVIVNRYPSTEEVIAGQGCGVCVDDFSQIGQAIGLIGGDYKRFASCCYGTYDDIFNFENYQQALLRFISE
jgi:glycosyltransferase involved in cell wall biosynthesis